MIEDMNSVTWDWPLFEALNFDGPEWLDSFMTAASGIKMWVPLYILIIYMVWRCYSWRGVVALVVALGLAIAMADLAAGIFKHQGPLADLWPPFPARLRPMHTSEGLDFAANGYYTNYIYGTVSGHTNAHHVLGGVHAVPVREGIVDTDDERYDDDQQERQHRGHQKQELGDLALAPAGEKLLLFQAISPSRFWR